MRTRTVLLVSIVLTFASIISAAMCQAQHTSFTAKVRVTNRVLNMVKPMVFGDNIEWIHHGMGLWQPETGTFNEELVRDLKASGLTHLRYPGGTLSDFFDWSGSIGFNRRPQLNPFEKGHNEYPDFGPDEFMALCLRLGIPGTITVNAGTGTPALAGNWAGYLRRKGFSVAQFEVGNDIYLANAKKKGVPAIPVAKTVDAYVDFYLKTALAIRKRSPGARVGAIGLLDTGSFPLNNHPDWMEKLLKCAGDHLDFIAIHTGYPPAASNGFANGKQERQSDDDIARCFLGASEYVRANIETTKATIAKFAPSGGRRIGLEVTEYGPLVYPLDPAYAIEDIAWNRSLAGALYQACLFNVFLRDPRIVSGNHLPLCQDGFGALVGVWRTGARTMYWRNIVFYVFQLYSGLAGCEVVGTMVEGPVFSTSPIGNVPALKEVPMVDAAVFRTKNHRSMKMFLVNRDTSQSAEVQIDPAVASFSVSSITTIAADSFKAENSLDRPDAVKPVTLPGPTGRRSGPSKVLLPRHSLTVVEFGL